MPRKNSLTLVFARNDEISAFFTPQKTARNDDTGVNFHAIRSDKFTHKFTKITRFQHFFREKAFKIAKL